MKYKNIHISNIINWVTIFLWIYYLLGTWTYLPLLQLISKYEIVFLSFILVLQITNNTNLQTLYHFKNRDFNFIIFIILISIFSLFLSHSRPGAILNITNFCMIWYLSDKWSLNCHQVKMLWFCIVFILFQWITIPAEINSNTISSVCYISLLATLAGCEYYITNCKMRSYCEFIGLIIVLVQVLRFHGRGSLIALLSYIFIRYILSHNILRSFKFYEFMCLITTLGSLLFVFLYTTLWRITGADFEMPIFNKPLFSGREAIWYELWGLFKNQPFIGTGSNLVLKSWENVNVHNSIYNILIIYGVFVFIVAMIFLLTKLFSLWKKYHREPIFIPVISGIFAVFMECYFEMNLFWTPIVFLWLFLPALVNVKTQEG